MGPFIVWHRPSLHQAQEWLGKGHCIYICDLVTLLLQQYHLSAIFPDQSSVFQMADDIQWKYEPRSALAPVPGQPSINAVPHT